MKDFRSLKVLDKFSFIFEKLGVDYKVMRKILQLKLIMDMRRVPTAMGNNKDDDKDKNLFMKGLLSYGVMGIVIMMVLFSSFSLFVKMSFCFGMSMFMIMTTMISDFSSVLLDVKDKNILLSKPIDAKTVNMAKIIHIFIYLFMITMAVSGPTLIAGTIKYGLAFFILFFFELLLISVFVIFLTSLLYTVILNFFDGEKLKDIINYFQILLSIVMVIGYQLIGRMFNLFQYDFVFKPKWWNYFIPPVWFAAPFEILKNNHYESFYIYLSILSIFIPILSLILHIKVIVPYFEKNLSKFNNHGKNKKSAEGKMEIHRKVARLFCFERMENIFFRFSQNMFSNERKLKLKIYPNIALAGFIPLISIFSDFNKYSSFSEMIKEVSNSKAYLTIYIAVLFLSSLINMISASENYKGAWIYRVLPIKTPSPIYKGALKGFILKFIVPVYIFISFVFFMIYGYKIILDLILIMLNMILLILIIFRLSSKELPFCRDFKHVEKDSFLFFIIYTGFCGMSAGLHMLFKTIPYGLVSYLTVVLVLVIFLWKKSYKIKWEDAIHNY